jgi:hypothetical protein
LILAVVYWLNIFSYGPNSISHNMPLTCCRLKRASQLGHCQLLLLRHGTFASKFCFFFLIYIYFWVFVFLQVDEEETTEVATPKQADPANEKSPKSAVSNGVAQTGEDDSLADSYSLKKQEDNHTDQLKSIDMPGNGEPVISDAEKVVNTESEAEQTSKKSAEKSPTKLTEPSESFPAVPEKEAEELPDDKIHGKDIPGSHKDQSVEEAISSENIKETVTQPSSPKASEGESVPVASPSVGESPPDESVSKKGGRSKKKESLNKHSAPSSDDVPKKVSDGTSDSELKSHKHSGKKAFAGTSSEDKTPMMTDASKKEINTTSEPEAKSLKQSSKEVDTSRKESDTASEQEAKPPKQSSKKLDASKRESDTTGEPEAKPSKQSSKKVDASRKESNTTGESEAKPLKQSSKKVDGSSSNDGLSLKQSEDKKRQSRGKAASEKHATKSSTKDDDKVLAFFAITCDFTVYFLSPLINKFFVVVMIYLGKDPFNQVSCKISKRGTSLRGDPRDKYQEEAW